MTIQELRESLCGLQGESENESTKLRIDNIRDILDLVAKSYGCDVDIEQISKKVPSIKSYIAMKAAPSTRLNNYDLLIERMLDELRDWKKAEQMNVKQQAFVGMSGAKKKRIIAVIVILGIIAVAALLLGIFGAIGKICKVWCDIIGVLDCVFGISFFMYELFDDKLKANKIDSGEIETISKGLKEASKSDRFKEKRQIKIKTGNIKNKCKGAAYNNSGFAIILNGEKRAFDVDKLMTYLDGLFND